MELRACLEGNAARRLGILQLLDAGEMPVGQHGIRQGPQMFGRLQFRGIGRQEQKMDVLGNAESHAGTSGWSAKEGDLPSCYSCSSNAASVMPDWLHANRHCT